MKSITDTSLVCKFRAEAPITDYSRDFVLDLEKYKVVQIFHVKEDRNQEALQIYQ